MGKPGFDVDNLPSITRQPLECFEADATESIFSIGVIAFHAVEATVEKIIAVMYPKLPKGMGVTPSKLLEEFLILVRISDVLLLVICQRILGPADPLKCTVRAGVGFFWNKRGG